MKVVNDHKFLGWSKSVLRMNGRRKGLTNLYDSNKWEFGRKNFGDNCWKKHRRHQYHEAN